MRATLLFLLILFGLDVSAQVDSVKGIAPEPWSLINPEQPPSFPGGDIAMLNFIRENLCYPEIDAQGIVWLRVNVQTDGTITDVGIVRGVQTELDTEALRIVRSFPRFEPSRWNGVPVCVSYNVPVKFNRGY